MQALALGARSVRGWSSQEERLAAKAVPLANERSPQLAQNIQNGFDPLGAAFCRLRSPETRRTMGATYTPAAIVSSMMRWARVHGMEPARIVEPGSGSARFLMSGGRRFKTAELVGIEVDPLPALITRANLAVCGFADRSTVLVRDYRSVVLPTITGATLYIGNPPYVRLLISNQCS